jgi:putative DNA primase/helicase
MSGVENVGAPPTADAKEDKNQSKRITGKLLSLVMGSRARGMVFWHGSLYTWEGGRYCEIQKCEEEAVVAMMFHNEGVPAAPSAMRDILLNLQASAHLRSEVPINSWLPGTDGPRVVVAQNGNICLDRCDGDGHPTLLPHTPDYFTLSKLPYAYDPKATCPKWLQFLGEVMEGDADRILLLQQWAGYLFVPNVGQQKFMLHFGSGGNGKGVFSRVMEELVGLENCSHVPLSGFRKPFEFSATLGKWLNTNSETTESVGEQGEAILKAYTAGDRMMFERKYKNPIEALPTAKIMLFANALPRFHDRSEGVWRRMLIVPWQVEIPEGRQNRNLANELREELPGIFNWAYEGMKHLEREGHFTEPRVCQAALSQYRAKICPEETFLREDYCECLGGKAVGCTEVYTQYVEWCSERGLSPKDETTLGRKVSSIFPRVRKSRLGPRNDRANCYVGIGPKDSTQGSVS